MSIAPTNHQPLKRLDILLADGLGIMGTRISHQVSQGTKHLQLYGAPFHMMSSVITMEEPLKQMYI